MPEPMIVRLPEMTHEEYVRLAADIEAIRKAVIAAERARLAGLVRQIDTADFNYEPAATAVINAVLALLEE